MRALARIFALVTVFCGVLHAEAQSLSRDQLVQMRADGGGSSDLEAKKAEATNIRLLAMRDAAVALGAQHGYIARINSLKEEISNHSDQLDSIFDFKSVMTLAHSGRESRYLLPPVLREVNNLTAISEGENQIRISGKMYQIEQAERLVSEPPNWRTYLVIDNDIETMSPSQLVLPKTAEERLAWAELIDKGWAAGMQQADEEMLARVRKLGTEFNGMLRYIMLATEGKVRRSEVAYSKLNVVGSGDEMRQDEIVYQLVKSASLNPDVSDWIPLHMDNRESLRKPAELNAP